MKLRKYQEIGVNHLTSGTSKLLLDEPGLGKTAQTIVAFNRLKARKVLIICPASITQQWADEVEKWSELPYKTKVVKNGKDTDFQSVQVVIMSYNLIALSPMLNHEIKKLRWGVLILDEIHYCKNSKAKCTKNILGKGGIVNHCIYRWGLSGSLMPNTPIDLFTVMKSIGRKHIGKYDNWFSYTGRYCGRRKTDFGWDVSGAKNLPELRNKLFGRGLAIARKKEEVAKELPSRSYRIIRSEATADANQIAMLWSPDLLKKKVSKEERAEILNARKEIALQKVAITNKYVKELPDDKLVIFCWHREVVEELERVLGSSVKYYGGMSNKQKEGAKNSFISNPDIRYFIANISSAGTGVDGLQQICSHCVFAETPWTYVEILQATDRLYRIGQESKVISDMLIFKDSIEEHIMRNVFRKEKYFKTIFGDK